MTRKPFEFVESYDINPADVGARGTSTTTRTRQCEFLTIAQLRKRSRRSYLVRGVISQGELVLLYAPTAVGKSLVALDLALRITTGKGWWGYATKRGSVLLLAGEGASGIPQRCEAWASAYDKSSDFDDNSFRVLPHTVAFMNDDEFDELLEQIKGLEMMPLLVIIDTLACFFVGGDENSAQHMGIFVDRCNRIREATGATVLVIHHTRRGSDAPRGSTVLEAAADVMLSLSKRGGVLTLKGTKAKDADPLASIRLVVRRVELGQEDDGSVRASVRLERADESSPRDEQSDAGDPAAIRLALLGMPGRSARGPELAAACGMKANSTFYKRINADADAGWIRKEGTPRRINYVLTDKAPELHVSFHHVPPGSMERTAQPGESVVPLHHPPRGVESGLDSASPDADGGEA